MQDRQAKTILQSFFAGENFLTRFRQTDVPQIAMRQRMGPYFMTSGEPIAGLLFVHQPLWPLAFDDIPVIGASRKTGNQKLDSTKTVAPQRTDAVLECVTASVIKRNDHFTSQARIGS